LGLENEQRQIGEGLQDHFQIDIKFSSHRPEIEALTRAITPAKKLLREARARRCAGLNVVARRDTFRFVIFSGAFVWQCHSDCSFQIRSVGLRKGDIQKLQASFEDDNNSGWEGSRVGLFLRCRHTHVMIRRRKKTPG